MEFEAHPIDALTPGIMAELCMHMAYQDKVPIVLLYRGEDVAVWKGTVDINQLKELVNTAKGDETDEMQELWTRA